MIIVYFSIQELRSNVARDDAEFNKKKLESGLKSSYGYGGKFGIQADRMDKVLMLLLIVL